MKRFNRKDRRRQSEDLASLSQETLSAATMSEAEVDEIAGASDLYERVQGRIAAKQTAQRVADSDRRGPAWLNASFLSDWLRRSEWLRRPRLGFAVAFAVLLLLLGALPRWLRTTSNAPRKVAILAPPTPAQTSVTGEERTGRIAEPKPDKQTALPRPAASGGSKRAIRRRNPITEEATEEIATDFIPLTWVTKETATESGQVLRVKVPRSMLLSIGVAVNAAGAEDFVLADVVVSDDGLARAIRLVN